MPRSLIAILVVLLVVHQDNWFWTDDHLVFGFLPVGLFYHACLSLAASATWLWAVRCCWPETLRKTGESE
jgi:hypothetical protein